MRDILNGDVEDRTVTILHYWMLVEAYMYSYNCFRRCFLEGSLKVRVMARARALATLLGVFSDP